jgi:alkanesulfonate monooxygenase SsuD/methylene tetrahydromethanopterin reductase-like flavin-dependent oxidoreductase (luciferase family)
MDVVYKLWEGSWEEDAFLVDRANDIFADYKKVHRINHQSQRYRVLGPHTPSPSPQRTPVLFQAGASQTGRAFAARHAEGTFIVAANARAGKKLVDETNQMLEKFGRRKGDLKFIQGLSFVVGSTMTEAQKLAEEWDHYNSVEGAMAHIARDIDVDLGILDPSTPVTSDSIEGIRGFVKLVEEAMPGKVVTAGDVGQVLALNTRIVGTPESIADDLKVWQDAGIDGVNVIYQTSPRSFVDFIEQVMPVLRKRGLAREAEVEPATLRERMFPGRGPRLNERHVAAQYRYGGPKSVVAASRTAAE